MCAGGAADNEAIAAGHYGLSPVPVTDVPTAHTRVASQPVAQRLKGGFDERSTSAASR